MIKVLFKDYKYYRKYYKKINIIMSNPEKKEKKNKYYYAVKCGFKPGIYTKWDECKEQVNGFPKPVYKKFDTEEDAKIFINPE